MPLRPLRLGVYMAAWAHWLLCARFQRLRTRSHWQQQRLCGKHLAQVIAPQGRLAEGGWRQETGEEFRWEAGSVALG